MCTLYMYKLTLKYYKYIKILRILDILRPTYLNYKFLCNDENILKYMVLSVV